MKPVFFEKTEEVLRGHELSFGLSECSHLCWPFEGPYTYIAKLCLLNVLTARELCEQLFGKKLVPSHAHPLHARSFLAGPWLKNCASNGSLSKNALSGALANSCGSWAQRIASDEQLRFCPSCLAQGYQSAVFQIDAIERCPIHGETLRAQCPHCGGPTPRYALTPEAFDVPMLCCFCERLYDESWSCETMLGGGANASFSTSAMDGVMTRLQRLAEVQFEWPDYLAWKIEPHDAPYAHSCRVHAYDLAQALGQGTGSVVDVSERSMVRASPALEGSALPNMLEDAWAERFAIYKSIRRHIERLVRPRQQLARLGTRRLDQLFKIDWGVGTVLPTGLEIPASLHAWLLWRHRCEANFLEEVVLRGHLSGVRANRVEKLTIRPTVRTWPNHWRCTPALWGCFVWQCFLEDLRTTGSFRAVAEEYLTKQAEAVDSGQLFDEGLSRNMQLLDMFRGRLSPFIQPWPEAISTASWICPDSGERRVAMVSKAVVCCLERPSYT